MSSKTISIRGARTHNLKNLSVELPHEALTMITGPSGSGKSSLAFDTLYAEGQRRFVESMSTYVRQFLERMERPDVDSIDGVLPAIAVEQKNSVKNARSTVATATEIADYARLFMTYCGETICPSCGTAVRKESPQSAAERILASLDGSRIVITAELELPDEGREEILAQLVRGGFYRAWVGEKVVNLEDLETAAMPRIDIVLGRFKVSGDAASSILDGIEQGFSLGKGLVHVHEQSGDAWVTHRFSSRFACDRCEIEFTEPTPHLFSFNSPLGACETCQGYGRTIGIDLDRVIPDRSRRLDELPISPFNSPGYEDCYEDLEKASKKYDLPLDVPIDSLTKEQWKILYSGKGKWYGIKGFFDWLESKKYKIHVRVKLAKYRSYTTCETCGGSRLKPAATNVRFRDRSIAELFAMDVASARKFWDYLPLTQEEEARAGHLRREILNRLVYLDEVGLGYLTLDRQTRTLSGGEAQRINLAAALGNGLTATLYVIDEPTVGLHARDSERLLAILRRLRTAGNTVVVVEHDPTMISGADWLVELGPGAGEGGGQVIYSGDARPWLERNGDRTPPPPKKKTSPSQNGTIAIREASQHNLKGIDVEIPLGKLVAITGVSGSGKSSLVRDCLYNGWQRLQRGVANVDVGRFAAIEGFGHVAEIEFVDQSPIGRSTRSNPATYVKAWDEIRKILASTQSAKVHGVTAGMFSFNTDGGRCETCKGAGTVLIDMQFLADIEVVCEQCDGKRFNDTVLKVRWKGMNVDQILDLTVDEAIRFFVDRRPVVRRLDPLRSVGLGYLRLGQSTATLSGGEAQRLKLASFLSGKKEVNRLFLFDEPTTGLHSGDVYQLLKTFRALIELGNSIVVIEHNLQMIEASDWVIDLGPEGGDAGGHLVATGTPEEVAANPNSITGRFLFAQGRDAAHAQSS
jgi:excinuclease ABC subunit A